MAFGFAGAGTGEALAVASGPLAGVRPSGGAPGSVVAPAGAGTAFGFAGAGVDAALAVASGFLPCVSSPLAGVRSSGETA